MKPTSPDRPLPAPARIWVLLASEASVAVVFRRGPSNWTRLYLWNTRTDEITPGSWFQGRLYEDMSDLSPDGEHLIYFARNESPGQQRAAKARFGVDGFVTWVALCRPPWVKAIGLWRIFGGFTGGGVFSGNRKVWVYFTYSRAETLIKPGGFTVMLGKAEDQPPVLLASMQRSSWHGIRPSAYTYVDPLLPLTLHKGNLELRLALLNFKVMRDYTWHGTQPAPGLEGASWADIDQQGRLVYARAGKLYAFAAGRETELADLNLDHPPARSYLRCPTPAHQISRRCEQSSSGSRRAGSVFRWRSGEKTDMCTRLRKRAHGTALFCWLERAGPSAVRPAT